MKSDTEQLKSRGALLSNARTRRFAAAFTRVALLLAVLLFGTAFLSLRAAEARLARSIDGLLSPLSAWPSGEPHTGERTLQFNGLEVEVLVTTVERPFEEALELAAARCRTLGGFDPEELRRAEAEEPELSGIGLLFDGVISWQSGGRGIVSCLDTGEPLTVAELARRARAYSRSRDLAEVGNLRFAQIRGNSKRSTVLWMWTEGSVKLESLFPKQGDAPGFDPPGFSVVRPACTRRLVSAAEHGALYAFAAYRCSGMLPPRVESELMERARKHDWGVHKTKGGIQMDRGQQRLFVNTVASAKGGSVVRVSQLLAP